MARRSDHNREELYELALSAAINIVEAEGFRALKARHVAERIGYSAGTLYNIFKNLDELIIHLNGRTLDELQAEISAVTLSGDALRDITSLVDVYLTYLEAHPNLWMALFDYKLPEGMPVPDWFALKVSMGLGIIETALAPLFVGAEPDASQNTARTFWASLHGICSLSQSGKLEVVSSQSARQMASILITNFVAGLSVNNSGG